MADPAVRNVDLDSDMDRSRRRWRTVVLLGVPTVAASVVVVLLGLPVWVVAVVVAFFAIGVLTNS